jgi:ubiquinone/menaquinone biosynthesis C-methylase UbiE
VDRTAKFWDRIAERYSKQPISDEAAYQKKLEVTRKYLTPEMELLEFGCGTGSTAIAHAPYVKHIQALDISPKMIEIAEGKAEAQRVENVTFERSTLDEVSVPDESMDAVLGLNILHLVNNKEGAIAKVYRMLKPGGVFVSSTVCLGDTRLRILKYVAPVGRLIGLNLKVFAPKELEDSLTEGGFEIDYESRPAKGSAMFIVARKPVEL